MEFADQELKLAWAVLSHELERILPPLSISPLKCCCFGSWLWGGQSRVTGVRMPRETMQPWVCMVRGVFIHRKHERRGKGLRSKWPQDYPTVSCFICGIPPPPASGTFPTSSAHSTCEPVGLLGCGGGMLLAATAFANLCVQSVFGY